MLLHDRRRAGLVLVGALLVCPGRAHTAPLDPADHGLDADGGRAAVLVGGGLATVLLARLIHVGPLEPWADEPLALDSTLRGRRGPAASRLSDALLVTSLALPIAMELGGGTDAGTTGRAIVYGEALLVSLALNTLTKRLVQRPRPYTYGTDPGTRAVVEAAGSDATLSFYSGHASTAFAAAAAGGFLLGLRHPDPGERAAIWSSGFGVAALTAMLRVRAGKHFYSDVFVGAVTGAAVGLLIPAVQHQGAAPLEGSDAAAMALGTLGGAFLGLVLPMPEEGAPTIALGPGSVVISGAL